MFSTPAVITNVHSGTTTITGALRRFDGSIAGRLNAEWDQLCADPSTAGHVISWARRHDALAGCASLPDVERAVSSGGRERADGILLALLRLGQAGRALAARTVLQLMLGKAIRIAAGHTGRGTRTDLEHVAVAALWTVIATYPVDRRPTKVAANIAMDTLRQTVAELAYQRHETPADPESLSASDSPSGDLPADLELLELLCWAVDAGAVSLRDAVLIVDVYSPAPGESGGAAAAERHGLSWVAARQRASRAIRAIARAVAADRYDDTLTGTRHRQAARSVA